MPQRRVPARPDATHDAVANQQQHAARLPCGAILERTAIKDWLQVLLVYSAGTKRLRPMCRLTSLELPRNNRNGSGRCATFPFGLIAEEVAEAYPDLVGRNPKEKPESARHEQINAMLLNEFLKERRKVEQLTKDFEFKAAGLQKVSAQLDANHQLFEHEVSDNGFEVPVNYRDRRKIECSMRTHHHPNPAGD